MEHKEPWDWKKEAERLAAEGNALSAEHIGTIVRFAIADARDAALAEAMEILMGKKWKFINGQENADQAIEVKTGAIRYVGEGALLAVEARNAGLNDSAAALSALRDSK